MKFTFLEGMDKNGDSFIFENEALNENFL